MESSGLELDRFLSEVALDRSFLRAMFLDMKSRGEEIFRRPSVYTIHLMNQLEQYFYLSLSGVGSFCFCFR